MHLQNPEKIYCNEADIKAKISGTFKVLRGIWITEINSAKFPNRATNQFHAWKPFLEQYTLEFPNMAQLFKIRLAPAGKLP